MFASIVIYYIYVNFRNFRIFCIDKQPLLPKIANGENGIKAIEGGISGEYFIHDM